MCRNLSHNVLSGRIGNVFSGLQNLVEMYDFSPVILFPLNWKCKELASFPSISPLGFSMTKKQDTNWRYCYLCEYS